MCTVFKFKQKKNIYNIGYISFLSLLLLSSHTNLSNVFFHLFKNFQNCFIHYDLHKNEIEKEKSTTARNIRPKRKNAKNQINSNHNTLTTSNPRRYLINKTQKKLVTFFVSSHILIFFSM